MNSLESSNYYKSIVFQTHVDYGALKVNVNVLQTMISLSLEQPEYVLDNQKMVKQVQPILREGITICFILS